MAEQPSPSADNIESGGPQQNGPNLNDKSEIDEYIGLDRYISTLRDGRRFSITSEGGGEALEEKRIPWWAPWRRLRKLLKKKHDGDENGEGDGTFSTPDAWLNTDMHSGLSENEIESRRKKIGWNELTAEKENMFLKFLSYFQGPILYGLV